MQPPIGEPEEFSVSGTANIPEKWWTSFQDTTLNRLVDQALQANLNLKGNWQQFQASLAVLRAQKSFLWPDIQASARSAISRPEPDFAGGENLQVGLSAAYEIDLWGRIRSGVDADRFRSQASYYDFQAAAMTLSAETSIAWYQLVTARKQLRLVNEQIETNRNIIKLIRARFTSGQIRAVDILRQEQLLENTKEQKLIFETNIKILEHEIAVLLGRPPQNEMNMPGDSLPVLPALPETGLPLELIRRRPDVKQAYQLVLAADRDMAQAISNKYPRISLNLEGQARSNNYDALFQDWAYTLAGNIIAPLLYGGRLRAEVDRTEALKNQVLFEYGQTVLTSFQEVEDALIREQKQKERIEVLERRLELSRKTVRQLRIGFLNGLSNYLDVLLSLDQQQQLQRDLIAARQRILEIRISLYRALAGDFNFEPAKTEPQIN